MKFIEVEYNEDLKPLETVLSGVKRAGAFFVSGVMEVPMPKVEIEGVGPLSFPVPEAQIQAMLPNAERAPYGRGEKTIVDTSVRKVWQIAPRKVQISGKSWVSNFKTILAKVSAGLGCEGTAISAELYKLLVYDKDGFFLPHRDTEKTNGMFGTLVITLPSVHRGGELRIRHADREVMVDTSAAEFSELPYVAFYADCEHEALPVRDGNRVCLVYNLVESRGKGKGKDLQAPDHESPIAVAASILDRWVRRSNAPAKIVWLLEHQYSPAGLSFSALKGSDAARAGVLVRAAERAQCVAHLGIVHISEYGAAEPDYSDYFHERRSRWNRYRDEEDNEDDSEDDSEEDADFTVVTVDDGWQYIDEWRDSSNAGAGFGRIPLAEGELLPVGALDKEPPDEKRLTEASGNEGASYERSYHRAALILWPRKRYADVLLQAGVVAALPYLMKLIASGRESRSEAVALAKRMAKEWQGGRESSPKSIHRIEMMTALCNLHAAELLQWFIKDVVTQHYDGSENPALISSVGIMGDLKAAAALSAMISARMTNRPGKCVELLLALSENPTRCFPGIANAVITGLSTIGKRQPALKEEEWEPVERRQTLGPGFLVNLFQALRRFKDKSICNTAAMEIAARPETFSPVTIVVPALEEIPKAPEQLWTASAQFLLGRSEVPPEPPADWRLDVGLSCPCPDCRELQAFARNPAEQVHRFRVKKERRQHLHQVIDKNHLEMTHVTERTGSPQTLVCRKDRRTFKRRMKQYENEITAMATLLRVKPGSEFSSALSTRLQAANERAAGRE